MGSKALGAEDPAGDARESILVQVRRLSGREPDADGIDCRESATGVWW